MALEREQVMRILAQIEVPGGGTLVSRDLVRRLNVGGGMVRFEIEVTDDTMARQMADTKAEAARLLRELPEVINVNVTTRKPAARTLRGHGGQSANAPAAPQGGRAAPPPGAQGHASAGYGAGPGAQGHGAQGHGAQGHGAAPDLRAARKPAMAEPPVAVPGVNKVIVVGSGKGGVGKSTVTANLAVALARSGRRVGLLDADVYGPSQPRMMGVTERPGSTDGKNMNPLMAHGVKVISMGLMVQDGQAIIWRGPMLAGAMRQLLGQVTWAPLDVLLIDLPPGTGDVQLTLCQKTKLDGAILVSTPQDVALIDVRRAGDMFKRLNTPIVGLIENMASYVCPNCGHESHPFGHGGVAEEAAKEGYPFLGEIPLDIEVRLSGDSGIPVAAGNGPVAEAYILLAERLIAAGKV